MKILLVEDEAALAETLADGLQVEGYTVDVAGDGQIAMGRLEQNPYDLLILDRDLPVISGDQICQRLRATGSRMPILMLTAAASVGERVVGLDLGADDYLPKPFAYVELLARIRALGRRGPGRTKPVYTWRDIRLDVSRGTVERNGVPVPLTPKEYGILEAVFAAEGGLVTTEQLLEEVWGSATDRSRGVVKSAVYTLRQKLGHPDPIEAMSARGYYLQEA